jgi:hypothetical protein
VSDQAVRVRSRKVGKLRPSQVVTQHGPGAVVDLPTLSVVMAGINYWKKTDSDRVSEPRLEQFLRVDALFRPPVPGPGKFGGLPAFLFPEYLVCPAEGCRRIRHYSRFSYNERHREYRCDNLQQHHNGRAITVFPARFMIACARGHMDDFPWAMWAHGGASDCDSDLVLEDRGFSGSANDLYVKCLKHGGQGSALGAAFGGGVLGGCSGRRPWLSPTDHEAGCGEATRTILRGASNAYFALESSALSIPPWSDPIQLAVAPYREQLKTADSFTKLKAGVEGEFYDISELLQHYTIDQIWDALSREPEAEENLKIREYESFVHPEQAMEPGAEFDVEDVRVPPGFTKPMVQVAAAYRLREVRALRGFTRIDAVLDLGERTDVQELEVRVAPLGLRENRWLPAVALRGEGLFVRLAEDLVHEWETRPAVAAAGTELQSLFTEWLVQRGVDVRPFPGMRYVLLHTLAHVLLRTMSLECGYSSSALRERIYCNVGNEPMSGLLIYTASGDSEGSLGGLVDLAEPSRLGPIILESLRDARFCASDPLCGDRGFSTAGQLNGSACHACLLVAETSCEFSNRLLDRNVLVETVGDRQTSFFAPSESSGSAS